jgi:hypothetical protein
LYVFADGDADAMDQDLSDNSSDYPFSDSSLSQEEGISTAEKISVCVPSEVRIEKEIVQKVWRNIAIL